MNTATLIWMPLTKRCNAVSHAVVNYHVAGKVYKLKAQKLINQAIYRKGKYSFS
ncbi:hypothetical protein SDC49_07375 [Lactobacillus sp. R2/2]|nr:hypothetical protein [Lactobacillus sp. R2/2]